MIVIFSNIL